VSTDDIDPASLARPAAPEDHLAPRADDNRAVRALRAIGRHELAWCLHANRQLQRVWLRRLMTVTSRLGDGWVWGILIVGLWARGDRTIAVRMVFAGATSTLAYMLVKTILGRRRPCELGDDFHLPIAPLDRWSFPSGHTMHAVSLSAIATAYYPGLAGGLVPFAGMIMISRVLLGLHYPSDVLAGAVSGYLIAMLAVGLPL